MYLPSMSSHNMVNGPDSGIYWHSMTKNCWQLIRPECFKWLRNWRGKMLYYFIAKQHIKTRKKWETCHTFMLKLEVTQPSHGMDSVTANHHYLLTSPLNQSVFFIYIKAKVLFATNSSNLYLFGEQRECHIHPKKWHKMKDKRPLFVAWCSQPTNSIFFLWFAGSKFGYFSQFTVFVWKCNMTLIWVCVICWGAQTKRAKPRNFVQSNKSLTR